MALIHIGFFSDCLGMQVSCDVILPQKASRQIGMDSGVRGKKHPVLWLLHGASDDHTIWQRRTSIERYAAPLGLAVVMPSVHLSSYANMAHGGNFYDYVARELPVKMGGFFPFSDRREDNYIAGLSMGGTGCLKIGLANPERYAAIGCMSAAAPQFRNTRSMTSRPGFERRRELTYGDRDITGTEEDLDASVRRVLDGALPRPRIYHAWGSGDFVCEGARKTRDYFLSFTGNPFDYTFEEDPGSHTWEFWDDHITHFLAFLGLKPVEGIRN